MVGRQIKGTALSRSEVPAGDAIRSYLESRWSHYLSSFERLVRINSFTLNPRGVTSCAEQIAELFAPLGFSAELVPASDERCGSHLFLTRAAAASSEPGPGTIVMVSHLDTVFSEEEERSNCFGWRIEGDRIYGPGTNDIKGGTIVAYMVLDALNALAPEHLSRAGWQFFFDAAEEIFIPDFPGLCMERMAPDACACLVFEKGRFEDGSFRLVTGRKGQAAFLLEAEGRSAHAGNKHECGASAIRQLAAVVETLEQLTDYSRGLTVNIGTISGGEASNRVPSFASAEGEMRAMDAAVFHEGVKRIRELGHLSTVAAKNDGFLASCKLTTTFIEEPWIRNPGTEKLYSLWCGAAAELGYKTVAEQRGGLSDGSRLWKHLPTLDGLGPAGENEHCAQRTADGSKDQEFADGRSFIPKALLNTVSVLKLIAGAER